MDYGSSGSGSLWTRTSTSLYWVPVNQQLWLVPACSSGRFSQISSDRSLSEEVDSGDAIRFLIFNDSFEIFWICTSTSDLVVIEMKIYLSARWYLLQDNAASRILLPEQASCRRGCFFMWLLGCFIPCFLCFHHSLWPQTFLTEP